MTLLFIMTILIRWTFNNNKL